MTLPPTHDLGFVHRWIPAPGTANAPTLLLLHGTGGDENDLLPLGRMLDPGANLLSPRGRVLENGMPRFFRRLAEGVFDVPDLIEQASALADFVEAASAAYGFDPTRLTAVGFSNGANVAAAVLLLRPEALSQAILLHPMVPLVPDTPPNLSRARVFIGAGRQDPMSPPAETERLAALLTGYGANVSIAWQSGGHGLHARGGAGGPALARRLTRSAPACYNPPWPDPTGRFSPTTPTC